MATAAELILDDIDVKYAQADIDQAYTRLYPEPRPSSRMFASFHQRLNGHFEFMNTKAGVNRHFNAHDSRELLSLMDEIEDSHKMLKRAGIEFVLAGTYQEVLSRCKNFLVRSGGSPIPDDFQPIDLIRHEPAFSLSDAAIVIPDRTARYELQMVGTGSYATVYRYIDLVYDMPIAVKQAKPDLDPKDLIRFRNEFKLLKSLRSPYVLDVYRYSEERDEYTMEFCDATLRKFVDKHNAGMTVATRRRIALQFLYGMNYLHSKDLLHRDVSLQNVLVRQYDGSVVVIKLSDFGLVKERNSELTSTGSETRGTIIDPTLASFKNYLLANEIYSIGFVLSFIFSGRTAIDACSGPIRKVVDRCVAHEVSDRYPDVLSIIRDVELLRSN